MTVTALRDLGAHMGESAESLRAEGHEGPGLLADALFVQVLADRQAAGVNRSNQLVLRV